MKLHETFPYTATTPDAVFKLIADSDFRKEAALSGGGKNVKVTVEPHGEGATVTILRTQPAEVPDFIKKMTGSSVTVEQVEQWGAPDAKGERKAKIKVSVSGQPAGMQGTMTLAANGKGAKLTVAGDVKVKVPFVGKKIEPLIAKAVTAAVRHDVREGQKRL